MINSKSTKRSSLQLHYDNMTPNLKGIFDFNSLGYIIVVMSVLSTIILPKIRLIYPIYLATIFFSIYIVSHCYYVFAKKKANPKISIWITFRDFIFGLPLFIKILSTLYLLIIFSSLLSMAYQGQIYTRPFFILLKRFLYSIYIFCIAYSVCKYKVSHTPNRISNFILVLLFTSLIPIAYSAYHMFSNFLFSNNLSFSEIVGKYDLRYKTLGFSGQILTLNGIKIIGSTSINFGILMSMLFMITYSTYKHLPIKPWLRIFFLITFLIAMLFTYSKTALLVLCISLFALQMTYCNWPKRLLLISISLLFLIITSFIMVEYLDINLLSIQYLFSAIKVLASGNIDISAGTTAKRVIYLINISKAFYDNPLLLLIGSGYGKYSELFTSSYKFIFEGFMIEMFFCTGFLGLILSNTFFLIMIWQTAHLKSDSKLVQSLIKGLLSFLIALYFSNIIGSNSIQSEFVGGTIFAILGMLFGLNKKSTSSNNIKMR